MIGLNIVIFKEKLLTLILPPPLILILSPLSSHQTHFLSSVDSLSSLIRLLSFSPLFSTSFHSSLSLHLFLSSLLYFVFTHILFSFIFFHLLGNQTRRHGTDFCGGLVGCIISDNTHGPFHVLHCSFFFSFLNRCANCFLIGIILVSNLCFGINFLLGIERI